MQSPKRMELLGYDLRVPVADQALRFWRENKRAQFDIHGDTVWPLSANQQVWPSRFISRDQISIATQHQREFIIPPIVVPRELETPRFLGLQLWASFAQMMSLYRAKQGGGAAGVAIAVAIASNAIRIEASGQSAAVSDPEVDPATLGGDWHILGYDVANELLETALYRSRISELFPKETALGDRVRLNKNGLFDRSEEAEDYLQRLKPHFMEWPNYVFALYRLAAEI